jgi:hypothetical protein
MDAQTAHQVLTDMSRVKDATRKLHSAFWFPLCVFGTVTLLAAAGGLLGGAELLGWMLLTGTVAGTGVVTWYYRRRAIRIGLVRRGWPYLTAAAAGIAACTIGSALVPARPPDAVSWLAVTGMYVWFACLERNPKIALLGALFGAVAAGFWIGLPDAPAGLLTSVEGGICVSAGLLSRPRRSR